MTALARSGEANQPPPRSNRIFNRDSSWYFSTREGKNAGPYDSRGEAEQAVVDFVDFLRVADWDTRIKYLAAITATTHTRLT